jgi:Protein of unknown function (DUF2948)
MPDLKLIALDAEDLSVVSAHLQDAVLRIGDMRYLPKQQRFAVLANRFDWGKTFELNDAGQKSPKQSLPERRRTAIRFERVLSAKISGLDLKDVRGTLALLAVGFNPSNKTDSPDGDVTLTFSGGAAIRLSVECLECEMRDLGAAWSTKRSPVHPSGDAQD